MPITGSYVIYATNDTIRLTYYSVHTLRDHVAFTATYLFYIMNIVHQTLGKFLLDTICSMKKAMPTLPASLQGRSLF